MFCAKNFTTKISTYRRLWNFCVSFLSRKKCLRIQLLPPGQVEKIEHTKSFLFCSTATHRFLQLTRKMPWCSCCSLLRGILSSLWTLGWTVHLVRSTFFTSYAMSSFLNFLVHFSDNMRRNRSWKWPFWIGKTIGRIEVTQQSHFNS